MVKAIITDIEGTTSSLSFVKEVLFPYAHNNLVSFIKQYSSNEQVQKILTQAKNDAKNPHMSDKDITAQMLQWIKEDQKISSLKELQGFIWEEGYKQEDFQGHIYEDAYLKLKEWHEQEIPLYIYSSGSVQAQKLIFGYTEYGDLNKFFSGYFDTKIGGKRETESYKKIAQAIQAQDKDIQANEMLFLSDMLAELDAASSAGMQVIQLIREGQAAGAYPNVSDFNEIHFFNSVEQT